MNATLPVQLHPATRTDLPALYALARRCLRRDEFSEELLAEKLFGAFPPGMTSQTWLAAADGDTIGFLQSVQRPAVNKAWIGVFAVAPHVQSRGVATQLLAHARQHWDVRVKEVEALAIPGNYFTPGLDPRYTAALSWLERSGFERFRDCVNLVAPLEAPFETDAEAQRLAAQDVEIRRATRADAALLDAFFSEQFGADWRYEAGRGLDVEPPALHLAWRGGKLIAFSAHSTQNREWGFFGPMGTAPEARGLGVGRVLLWHCLNDLRAAGHRSAVIPWVGPISFYYRAAGCAVRRVFWRYRLPLG